VAEPPAEALPFPDSLCQECAAPPKYVKTPKAVYIFCPVFRKYPPQPVLSCEAFRPRPAEPPADPR